MIFTGKITEISKVKEGKTKKGDDWASLDFEVTESNPHNELYPQIALFSYFKSGEYSKYAKEFTNYFKIGDEVNVDFNLKCQKYMKDNIEKKFYKTECWKLEKVEDNDSSNIPSVEQPQSNDSQDDLPF